MFEKRIFALLLAIPLIGFMAHAANATRLSADFKQLVEQDFPGSKVRLDGAIELKNGDLMLPVIPGGINVPKWSKPQEEFTYPDKTKPELVVYTNGWCYLKVIKKGHVNTFVLPPSLTEKTRKRIFTGNFPSDLIVPENFVLPKEYKELVGDLQIKIVDEAELTKLESGPVTIHHAKTPISDHGVYVVNSLHSGTLILLDDRKLSKLTEFPTEGTLSQMVAIGNHLYISDQAKARVLILDPSKREFVGQIDLEPKSAPKGIATLPNGQLIYVAESGSNDIAIIETVSKKVLLRTKVPPGPGRLAVTPNGYYLLVLNAASGQLTILSTGNQSVNGTVKVGGMPTAMAISNDSKRVYITNRLSNTLSIVDLGTKQVLATLQTGNAPTGLALSRDNERLFVACARDNSISIFDLKTNQKLSDVRLPLDLEFPGNLELTPDGKKLFVTSEAADALGLMDLDSLTFDTQSHLGHTSHDIIWVPVN